MGSPEWEQGRLAFPGRQPYQARHRPAAGRRAWAKEPAPDPQTRFERSRALALLASLGADAKSGVTAAVAKTFADQSVAAFAVIVKSGFSLASVWKEPDFDALRGRADFQTLLAEVEAKAEKPKS